ncbi:phage terminase large subunit family protein [Chitinibacteraceae bacterium HSL-7]
MPTACAAHVVGQAWLTGLMPDPDIGIVDWADAYRYLPPTSAESGRYRSGRTPFMRPVMRFLSPSNTAIDEIILVKGGQISGSETANNFIGFIMHIAPGPAMLVQPTVDAAKDYVRERINPLIEYTPVLRDRVAAAKSRQGDNTARFKRFPGGFLAVSGANSAQGLQSRAVRYLVLDEIDRYPKDVNNQGDPVGMATKRTDTYKRTRKIFKLSTPGNLEDSRIWKDYLETDQRRIFVPCPHCGHMDYLRWSNLRWPKGRPDEVRLYCESCGAGIEEHHKTWMFERAEDRPTAVSKRPRTVGIHVPGLYSPLGWRSWSDIVRDWEQAQEDLSRGDDELMKKVVTLDLGEPYARQGEQAVTSELQARAESYPHRMVPHGGLVLTAAVDVQANRLELLVVAWGRGEEAWIVDRHILWGDTLQEAVWRELDAYMVEPLRHQSGVPMRVTAYSVDSGDGTRQHMVYDYVRKRQALGAMAIKGANTLSAPELATPKMAEIDVGGRKVKSGVLLWMVGVHRIKTALYARLAVATPGRNCIHFGSWLPDEFYTQLTAEKLVPRRVAGRMVKRWELPSGARNEAWDLLVYNYATALRIGINRWGEPRWDAIEQAFRQGDLLATPSHDGAEDGASESIEVVDVEAVHAVEAPPAPSATVTTSAAPRPQRRTARSSYLQR